MKFRLGRPIFQQIAEHLEEQILAGALAAEGRVPAVREYAVALEVNPNTVVRSFLELEQSGILFKKRGLGYFVGADARERILKRRRQTFLEQELPEMFQKMRLLDVSFASVAKLYSAEHKTDLI